MGWPKGKSRKKKKSINIDNLNKEQTKQLLADLEQTSSIQLKINQARDIIREPFSEVKMYGTKVYFISLINEKIISFKISE